MAMSGGGYCSPASLLQGTVGPSVAPPVVSLRGGESLDFYVTSHPSHSPKPWLYEDKDFCPQLSYYSLSL